MGIPVKLEVFEGPLDLLLHLIEKNKVDIYDIPIVLITEQYLDYVRQMDTKDMDVMSEFLVMAATLVRIKSKMLLPPEKEEEEEYEDPRQELVERILEYKMYKFIALELQDKQVDAAKTWYRKPLLPKEVATYQYPINYEELAGDVDLVKLHEIFNAVMRRQKEKIDPVRSQFGRIEKDEINLEEKQGFIETYVKNHRRFSFRNLLEKQGSRMEVIVTFMAILEMMKQGTISIEQEDTFADIVITSRLAA